MAREIIAPAPDSIGCFCRPNAGLLMAAAKTMALVEAHAQAAAKLPMAANAADPAIPKYGLCNAA
jgi:hypothetical protein